VSRSPDADQKAELYEQGWSAINRLIRRDGSWSGHERNCFYLNNGDGTFIDASGVSGLDFPQDGRSFVSLDFDHDGDLDLILKSRDAPQLRLLRNDVANDRAAVSFFLEGRTSNRDAVGARVEVRARGGVRQKTLRSGSGYLSQNTRWLHFGLEGLGPIEKVVVHWPSGRVQTLDSVPGRRRVRIVEGEPEFALEPFRPSTDVAPPSPGEPSYSTEAGTWLLAPLPAPDFTLIDSKGETRQLSRQRGKKVLLNFWATWCPPCRLELVALNEARQRLEAAGVSVLAVSVDEPPADEAVRAFARELRLELPLLLADSKLIGIYNIVARNLFDRVTDLAIPTSFLLSENGEIVKVYRGAVGARDVERDAGSIPRTPEERRARGLPFPGRLLFGELERNDFGLANELAELGYAAQAEGFYRKALEESSDSAKVHYNLGTVLLQLGRQNEAREAFQSAVERNPRFAEAHNNLGLALAAAGEPERALAAYRQALQIRPRFAEAHNNLGSLQARRGQVTEAIAAFQEAIEESPQFWRAHFNLGTALSQAGRAGEALASLRLAYQLAPSALLCSRLVRSAIQAGEPEEAQKILEQGLERWSDDPEIAALAPLLLRTKDLRR
jgi:tetratricopeptide (TPR) repeat protein